MSKPHHWNDWAGVLTVMIQCVVYIPLFYVIFMPWLCLALVKFELVPFIPGFFQAMASTGWLIASAAAFLFVVFVLLRGLFRKRRESSRASS
ncbi:hypothetical protein [Pseudomonas sp. KB-10]|jgi:hypothetical protein|uniref:hypothetical protein n=1 Tax=Pseudomonas sp. KB-10 TaxID=2292264 RepID=UPI001BB07090|nr:hypothetical protein [Pseudomonas sp. KB-10]